MWRLGAMVFWLTAGMFLAGEPCADAIYGSRIAKRVITARRARQATASRSGSEALALRDAKGPAGEEKELHASPE